MTVSKRSSHSIVIVMGIIAVFCAAVVFAFMVSPPDSNPTPTTVPPTAHPSNQYQPEIIPAQTDSPASMRTEEAVPIKTSVPALIPTVTPAYTAVNGPLPDLVVTGISDPVCMPQFGSTTMMFNIYVENVGRKATHYFGPSEVGIFLIVGQQRYSLDEWRTRFDSVVGNPNLVISNIGSEQGIRLALVLDMKGVTKFELEATANTGVHPIPEADVTNNTLTKRFSFYCY